MFFLDNFFVIAFLGHSLTDLEKRKKNWGRMGGHELFIPKFEGDLAFWSPKLEKNGPKLTNQAS